jgi:hypothetical protein
MVGELHFLNYGIHLDEFHLGGNLCISKEPIYQILKKTLVCMYSVNF